MFALICALLVCAAQGQSYTGINAVISRATGASVESGTGPRLPSGVSVNNVTGQIITNTSLGSTSVLYDAGQGARRAAVESVNGLNVLPVTAYQDVNVTRLQTNTTFALPPATSRLESAPTGQYDYAAALKLSWMFYEIQRSGPLPPTNRISWRASSTENDPVVGGWFDA